MTISQPFFSFLGCFWLPICLKKHLINSRIYTNKGLKTQKFANFSTSTRFLSKQGTIMYTGRKKREENKKNKLL